MILVQDVQHRRPGDWPHPAGAARPLAELSVTLAVIGAVVGEFVGSDKGLGYVIVSATSYWRSNLVFAAMLLLAAMAVGLFALVELCERLVCPSTAPAREQPEPAGE
jgi:ABC-type nitrate/sulfonate/bicarbonate transport system permease component